MPPVAFHLLLLTTFVVLVDLTSSAITASENQTSGMLYSGRKSRFGRRMKRIIGGTDAEEGECKRLICFPVPCRQWADFFSVPWAAALLYNGRQASSRGVFDPSFEPEIFFLRAGVWRHFHFPRCCRLGSALFWRNRFNIEKTSRSLIHEISPP